MAERLRFRVAVPEGSALGEELAPLASMQRGRELVRLAERGLAAAERGSPQAAERSSPQASGAPQSGAPQAQATDLGRIAAALERIAAGAVSVGMQARPTAPDVGAGALTRVRGLEAAFGDDLAPGPDAQAAAAEHRSPAASVAPQSGAPRAWARPEQNRVPEGGG